VALVKNLSYILLGEDKSASKTMTGAAETAEKSTGRIGGAFSKLGGVVGGEFGEVLGKVGEGMSNVGEHTGKMSAAMTVGGGVIAGVGVALMNMGSADKQASDQLQQAVKNSGHSYGDFKEDVEKAIGTQENFGHSAVDTQNALQKLTQATNDPKKALEEMGLVSNLAAARHIKLSDAADLVDKVISGKGTRTLQDYGITLGTSKDKTKNAEDALASLGKKLDGQAGASMNNFGAQVGVVKTKIEDWAAIMGQKVGPVLTALGPVISIVGVGLELMKTRQLAATAASLVSTTVTEGETAATEGAAVAQRGFNLAMLANPIGIVIGVIVLLVAGLIWFFTQTKLGKEVWKDVTSFIGTVVNWLWTVVIQPVFTAIGAIFGWLWNNIISPIATWIGGAIHVVGDVVGKVFGGIGNVIKGAFDGVVGFIKGIINTIIDVINGAIGGINLLIKGINLIPGIHIGLLGTIPHLATGGTMSSGGLAMVGENGPEVVSLPGGATVFPHGSGAGGGDGTNIHVHLTGTFGGSTADFAKLVVTAVTNAARQGAVPRNALSTALTAS
jgi:hypothetical protein